MRLSSANRRVDSESTILVAGDFSKGIAIRAGQAAVSAILRVADHPLGVGSCRFHGLRVFTDM
jgi:hypothetical protein